MQFDQYLTIKIQNWFYFPTRPASSLTKVIRIQTPRCVWAVPLFQPCQCRQS